MSEKLFYAPAIGLLGMGMLADLLTRRHSSKFYDEFAEEIPFEPLGASGAGDLSWTAISFFAIPALYLGGYYVCEWWEQRNWQKESRHVTSRPWQLSRFPHDWLSDQYEVRAEDGSRCGMVTIWELAGLHASGKLPDHTQVYVPPTDNWMTLETFRQHMHEAALEHEQRQLQPSPAQP